METYHYTKCIFDKYSDDYWRQESKKIFISVETPLQKVWAQRIKTSPFPKEKSEKTPKEYAFLCEKLIKLATEDSLKTRNQLR